MRKGLFLILVLIKTSCVSEQEPLRLSSDDVIDIENLLIQANIYYQNRNYNEAMNIHNQVLLNDSTVGISYFQRGYCRMQLRDYQRAVQDYSRAIELNYRIEDAYFNMACTYAAARNDSLALFYFNRSLELKPHDREIEKEIDLVLQRLKSN